MAEDKVSVVINDTQSQSYEREARNLLEFYPGMRSCIGVPVIADLPRDLALFALDKHPHQTDSEQIKYVQAIASAVGAYQEWQNLHEQSIFIQRFALLGHLTRGMVHEINNLTGPLIPRFDNLEFHLKKLEDLSDRGQLSASLHSIITGELTEIRQNLDRVINTTRMFRRISARGRDEILRVDEVIDETIRLMRDICERSRVQITFTPPEHLLLVRIRAASLAQAILNVLLNAVQQIADLQPGSGGWIHVQIEPPYEEIESSFLRILVEDNGPGIHVGLWNRIFEAGYTTRVDGSGLGLYISRNLMEDVGGQLYIKESHILSGTIFVLEIPVTL